MNRDQNIIPPRQTPNPRHHQQSAADLMRSQIAQIYDEPTDQTPQQQPSSEQSPQQAPAENSPYKKTYQDDVPFDWRNYHSAWQQYYQEYYQRYYTQLQQQAPSSQPTESAEPITAAPTTIIGANPEAIADEQKPKDPRLATLQELQSKVRENIEERARKTSKSPHFKPVITALVVGLVFLGLQFNQVIAAQVKYYISPGTTTNEGSSLIIDPTVASGTVGPDPRIIIPKINVDVPVVYDVTSYKEADVQKALERGVVHYGNTSLPGVVGNNAILGHSSNDMFSGGDYKFAFIRLDALENGDVIILNYQGKRYVYKVYNKAVIEPTDFSLINITPEKPVVTLITCTPPGTALKRLVVQAEQISPAPASNQAPATPSKPAATNIPSGNAPSLLERLFSIF